VDAGDQLDPAHIATNSSCITTAFGDSLAMAKREKLAARFLRFTADFT